MVQLKSLRLDLQDLAVQFVFSSYFPVWKFLICKRVIRIEISADFLQQ